MSKIQKAFPAGNALKTDHKSPLRKKKAARNQALDDDTPRAFARLMAYHTKGIKLPSGLDDGIRKSKKRKRAPESSEVAHQPETSLSQYGVPKIKPGERMSEFSARVDAALPVSGLIGKGGKGAKNLPGVKAPQTKFEKRMQRMQKEWREVEERKKEKLEEEMEEAEEEEHALTPMLMTQGTKKAKKGKKRNVDDDDDDPWAAIGQARAAELTPAGLVGLHDVVKAPPHFTKVPKEKFRVKNGAKVDVLDIPSAAGSLRRREELGKARRSVVEGYREMMRAKREAIAV